ncbi:MAG: D-alanyl-D-alanine carboxypeptidase/D-alanyl-D-alanine-endopeptidase [Gaiellaceae bacterium]
MRRALLLASAALLLVPAGGASSLPLTTRLANALAVRGNSTDASGAVAVDLATGRTLFARHADLALEPASNEKLAVAFAALHELRPSYRFRTAVLARGSQRGAVWRGDVFLKGFGDPTLTSLELVRLATQLRFLGIQRISGHVLGDESWFDSLRTAPGWKASFFISECRPLSALVVDRGLYDGHIALRPALAAAGAFRRLLREHGIRSGAAAVGRAPAGALPLAEVESHPLARIVAEMDHESDNFEAEMLLKTLGAEVGNGGTTPGGAAIVLRDLAAADIPLAGVRIVDGSGLSLSDRLTADALGALLVAAWNDPAVRKPFWGSLPVAGISGTLEDRFRTGPARGVVRAKTGTTSRASALSGYVRDRYVFAVLQNGFPVSPWPARAAQDRFVTALASAR